MNTVVGVMLDYGLQYVQERSQDGTYNYVLDPNIYKVGVFGMFLNYLSQIRIQFISISTKILFQTKKHPK